MLNGPKMGEETQIGNDAITSIISQAEKELLSPDKFYRLCHKLSQSLGGKKLYFYQPDTSLWDLEKGIGFVDILIFFDFLALELKNRYNQRNPRIFYLQKKPNLNLLINQDRNDESHLKVTVEIVGEGMIGRVAKVTINDQYLAFKTFFDPDFVWQHGVWAETAIGIYLKAHKVTKNMAEFKFGGETWSVWEWIDPHTNPATRKGITYEELAQKEGLTKLNTLNIYNYNLRGIRLDAGGIQKEYRGRKLDNFWWAIIFYLRKIQREGILSLIVYLKKDNLIYVIKRLKALVVHG